MMSAADEVQTATVLNDHEDDQNWVRALKAAVIDQGGSWDPADETSRTRLLGAIQSQGYPLAKLEYLPEVGGRLPRISVWRDGRAV